MSYQAVGIHQRVFCSVMNIYSQLRSKRNEQRVFTMALFVETVAHRFSDREIDVDVSSVVRFLSTRSFSLNCR